MEVKINKNENKTKKTKSKLKDVITLKRAPTTSYNPYILRNNTSKIDLEKAHYEAELLLNEEDDSEKTMSQSIFKRKNIGLFKFYCHFFESIDWFYYSLGVIGAIACGIASPIFSYLSATVYSGVANTSEQRYSQEAEEIMKLEVEEVMNSHIKKEFIYGSISLAGETICYFFLGLVFTRCIYNFKKRYFSTILSQEQGWFDSVNVFEFSTKIQAQIEYLELGLNQLSTTMYVVISIGIISFIFSFFGSWKLTLVLLCLYPIVVIIVIYMIKTNVRGNSLVRETWELAGGIAEEILYNIKTIASFSNFDFELKRFYEKVEISNNIELKVNLKIRICVAALYYLLLNMVFFIAFIYGRTLVKKDFNSFRGRDFTGGDITLTYECIINFICSTVDLGYCLMYVKLSLAATSDYFNLYERKPEMDLTESVEKPPLEDIKGKIEFNNVNFYYPSDKDKKLILNGINLNFDSGKKIALIGESGCGKTTIVNLIERLYDITGGDILLDGIDIRKYDIQYLRNLIGYVEQQPVLFNKSIKENIVFGREDYIKEKGENIDELIQKACDEAYVSEFITNLPEGLDYSVGLQGSKLSGGQKQRIAIARALLIKPKILILDEATSALDNKSEKIVQKALDNICKKNITTIIIAHRLSTIKNADLIYAIKNGIVYEQGTHEELLKKGGYYAEMIRPQLIKKELENQDEKEDFIRRMTSTKRVNTDEEVHFESKISEISKSPDDVHINICNIFKDFCHYKLTFIFSVVLDIALGAFPPLKGYIIGKCINAVSSEYQTIRYDDGLKFSLIFLSIGVGEGIIDFIAFLLFHTLGINMTRDYRNKMMKKFLNFHLSYFDLDINSPGSLLTNISLNTIQLREYTANILGVSIHAFSIFISSLIVGFCNEYRLTLIIMCFLLFLITITIIRRTAIQSDDKKSLQVGIEGGGILSECITNSKTIFAYNFSKNAVKLYLEKIDYITQQMIRDNLINGFMLGLIDFSLFACNASIFAASKKWILNDTLDSEDMFVIQSLVLRGYSSIITSAKDMARLKKAFLSLKNIYSVLETESLIPQFEKDNINKLSANNIQGKIELKNVYFSYPTNPSNVILKNVSFTIMPGEKVALVGYSGCGKSSIIQLLNRFYDVEDGKGEILIDDINIKEYNLYELRKKIGLVSQEPSVFKRSIIENIRYGNLNASNEECLEAAKESNALNIMNKEQNGENDNKNRLILSGGERQKIAVARVFLKNPVILLLDEPTSALDKESELNIQNSLDKLSNNKTTVSIAHRLNTIEHYDKIIVLNKGRISEQGTHEELMKLKKRYYTLFKYNNLS